MGEGRGAWQAFRCAEERIFGKNGFTIAGAGAGELVSPHSKSRGPDSERKR